MHLIIDGKQVEAERDSTVLEAARRAGINIPTLCYHPALTPYGACRMCVVEVFRRGRSRVVTSCTMPVEEGLEVRTNTPLIRKCRQIIVELLLARCPTSPEIRNLARDLGVEDTRFHTDNEQEKCILCGLCYRTCEELMKVAALGVAYRGGKRLVTTPFGEPSDVCLVCGACAFVCPTGTIDLKKISGRSPIPLGAEYDESMRPRGANYIPFAQAVPNQPRIDPQHCMFFQRGACQTCAAFCEVKAINYYQTEQRREIKVGAVVLAPGFEVFSACSRQEYGYARYPNVVTSIEFERILSASGPTGGQLARPTDGELPSKIAFIQCVGSRDLEHSYCSSICCMYATKQALLVKEHYPQVDCSVFYIDIRAYGKGFEEYFERAKQAGIRFVRSSPSAIKEIPGSRDLRVRYVAERGAVQSEDFNLAVLSVGMTPPPGVQELARILAIDLRDDGFCKTDPFRPVDTTRRGVFAAGPFVGPKDIPETVMDASAAAARALGIVSAARGTQIERKEYPAEKDVSVTEPRIGVFVCHCGSNIGGVVDVASVAEYARTLPGVVYAESNLYTCSNDTQLKIQELIREHNLNRVVVASCTPRTHEPLFRNTVREAGLNPYLFEMANIRDQCSWVHPHDRAGATEKAKDLVRMAVAKARLLEPLKPTKLRVQKRALVIGGGIAGLVAARDLAGAGFPVILVEKTDRLGGKLRRLRFLPDRAVPEDRLSQLLRQVQYDPAVTIRMKTEVVGVSGCVGDFRVVLAGSEGTSEENVGAIVVATGADELKPSEYLYGSHPKIVTQTELEERWQELLGPSPKPDETYLPGPISRVVMIQCVGSRTEGRPYCSRVCCTQAVKNAIQIKEAYPDCDVVILYRDIRTYGFFESEYREARAKGVTFLRYEPDQRPEVSTDGGRLTVRVPDLVLGGILTLEADLVVLAPAIVPGADTKQLAQTLKVPLTRDGFFLEAHMKLRPVDFASDGIFVCGLAHSPKQLSEAVAQASAAAVRAATVLSQDEIELEPTRAEVVPENCDGCAFCVDPCPFQAIRVVASVEGDKTTRVIEIDESLCKGCGVCQATCPKEGVIVRGFTLRQLRAQVEAALQVTEAFA